MRSWPSVKNASSRQGAGIHPLTPVIPVAAVLEAKTMPTVSTAIISGAAELRRRSSRAPEYERESRALVRLARAQTGPRDVLLQTIVDAALELCRAGSAGISLVEELDGNRYFRWLAVAGQVAGLRGNLTAWKDCPCAIAPELQESLLLVDPLQTFEALRGGPAYITEGLVVPIETDGVPLGAIWVMSHSDSCRFEQTVPNSRRLKRARTRRYFTRMCENDAIPFEAPTWTHA